MTGRLRVLLALAGLSISSTAHAECIEQTAPSQFEFVGGKNFDEKTPGNVGILAKGFVKLSNGSPTVHGIDVSKYQDDVDFEKVTGCGAKFAYVRLSAGQNLDNELQYRVHWENARAVRLMVGPYHNLSLIVPKSDISKLPEKVIAQNTSLNEQSARRQARNFVMRLREVLSLDPRSPRKDLDQLGQPILPIALDVSWRPQIEFGSTSQKIFGRSYVAAICAWIDEVHSAPLMKNAKIILFTYPEIYSDYSLASASCNLQEIPVWISHHSQDGDLPNTEKNPAKLKLIAELCQGPNGDRCIIQQYTSFGGFGIFASEPSLDMDRFIGTIEELEQLQQTFESR